MSMSLRVSIVLLCYSLPVLAGTTLEDKGEFVEVAPGTKLCDPDEDVYGYYQVNGPMKPDMTQEVVYYRFGPLPDPKTGLQERWVQPDVASRRVFKRHPVEKNKLQVIDPVTGAADEFPYAPCKKQ